MKRLRKVAQFTLNQGHGMALGLFNVYNESSDSVSYWFNEETKDMLIQCEEREFIIRCKQLAGNNIKG